MNADDLARRILVRHREEGYLRLELPPEICHAPAAVSIETALRGVPGVYRINFYAAQRRLAVSFDAHGCAVTDVARALRASLGALPEAEAHAAAAPDSTPAAAPLAGRINPALEDAARTARQAFRRLREQIEGLRRPKAAPGSLQAKLQPMLANALTEKAIINFLNDLVAFYLVKVHWELISQRWLKEPVKNANAWLTVFYLMFLLVRYRKSIAAEAARPAVALTPAEPS